MNETGSAIAVAIVLIPLAVIWVMALFHIPTRPRREERSTMCAASSRITTPGP